MKQVISYLGSGCKNCIKCVKSCPMDAISIVNEQVIIDEDKCINCDICIQASIGHDRSEEHTSELQSR